MYVHGVAEAPIGGGDHHRTAVEPRVVAVPLQRGQQVTIVVHERHAVEPAPGPGSASLRGVPLGVGTRRQAFYTNLSPGAYRFHVVAVNDGVASDREAVWTFSLAPAFYQTRWFTLALVLLAAGGVAAAWRVRVHRVRGRFSAILVERTRVAREIHDTLLQSLLGVMLQLDHVTSEIDRAPQDAKDLLHRLRRQVEFHIREARHSIRDLRSPVLQSRDLVSVLADQIEWSKGEESVGRAKG